MKPPDAHGPDPRSRGPRTPDSRTPSPRRPSPEELLRHRPYLERLAAAWSRDGHGADDLVQDTLLAALERPPREPRALRRWLAVTLGNRARNQAARRSVRETLLPDPDVHGEPPAEVAAGSQEGIERVLRSLSRLPRRQRTVVELVYLEGLELDAVARRLGIGLEAARTRKKRGLARMRAELSGRDRGSLLGVLLGLASWRPARAATAGEGSRAVAVGGVAAALALAVSLPLVLLGRRPAAPGPDAERVASAATATAFPGAPGAGASRRSADASADGARPSEPERTPAVARASEPGRIEMRLHVAGTDEPWADLPVLLVPARPNGAPRGLTRTDGTGLVRFDGVAAGAWALWTAHGDPQPVALGGDGALGLCGGLPAADCLPGIVVDAHGAPVAGAELRVAWPGRPGEHLALERSDAAGRFEVRGLGAGLAVHAAVPGARSRAVRADAPELAAGDELVLRLVPLPRAVRGRVLDPGGAPAASACVTLWSAAEAGGPALAPAAARTGADGTFELAAPARGGGALTVRAPGRAPLRAPLPEPDDRGVDAVGTGAADVELTLRLEPPFALRGRARGPDGRPAPARVAVDLGLGLGERVAVAGADGRFALADLPRTPLDVRAVDARPDGGARSWLGTVAPRGDVLELDVLLSEAHGIAGAAVGEGGPLAGWTVACWRPDRGPRGAGAASEHDRTTVTDAAGRFAFPACVDADWRVELLGPPGVDAFVVDARDAVRPGARLELTDVRGRARPGRVSGVVAVPAGGAPGARLLVRGAALAGAVRVRFDPRSGRFQQVGLPPGRYELVLADLGPDEVPVTELTVEAGRDLDLGRLEPTQPLGTLRVVLDGPASAGEAVVLAVRRAERRSAPAEVALAADGAAVEWRRTLVAGAWELELGAGRAAQPTVLAVEVPPGAERVLRVAVPPR